MKLLAKSKYITTVLFASLFLLLTFISYDSNDDDDTEENLPDITGFPMVGTNQTKFFNNTTETTTQSVGDDFYGQNGNYPGTTPSYKDNGDGTVTDMVTGLMWEQSFDHNGDGSIDADDKLSYADILAVVNATYTGDYSDWRVPTI